MIRYMISPIEAAGLYGRSPRFRRLLQNGQFIYEQERFCLAFPPWYREGRLAAPAILHPEKCCIGFQTVLLRPPAHPGFVANRSKRTRGVELCSVPEGFSEGILRRENELSSLRKDLPADFSGTALELLKRTGLTHKDLASKIGVDEKTIQRFLYSEAPKRHMVFAFGFAIQAAAPLFDELVRKAGYGYAATKEDDLIQLLRGISPNPGLDYCNRVLADGGCLPLP